MTDQLNSTVPNILILGIGNLLWADEGFGVRAVERLQQRFEFPDNVKLMDGGCQGVYLIQHVQEADVLVVLDAVDFGLSGGTMTLHFDKDVPSYLGAKKVSLHQTGFQEVLALAEMLGHAPQHIMLAGVQPVNMEDYGGSLTEEVKARLDPAGDAVIEYLNRFGVSVAPRAASVSSFDALTAAELDISRYESERPDENTACRVGDERVLLNPDASFDPKQVIASSDAFSVSLDKRRQD
ncbi:HyaD/HybD family hydrogenase maturation endopeptidase [Parasalinivibrio latis]|uniref:HyaD/HybD family hydrogenase maturation endopeptidase n=1 Tax=Parasalinivibrio latis TaxID=2952610 RepID=UPI0030DFF0B4